jgi:hypothetical protein
MLEDIYRTNCRDIRDNFEGREAIYIEKGVLRVRVSKVVAYPKSRCIEATVHEIPTPGLQPSLIHVQFFPDEEAPISWTIGAGYLSIFSAHTWAVGYGGWSLTTEPETIEGVVALASTFTSELNAEQRYGKIMEYIYEHPLDEDTRRVFPDED